MRFIKKTICYIVCLVVALSAGFVFVKAQTIADFLPEPDLIEMLCLTSRQQANDLSAKIAAYQEFFATSSKDIPDLSELPGKVDFVCQSQTYEGALDSFAVFMTIAKSMNLRLQAVDKSVEDDINQRINDLINQITANQKKSLQSLISQEKAKKEKELENFANQLAQKAQKEIEDEVAKQDFPDVAQARQHAFSITNQMQNILQNQVDDFALRAKNDLKQTAQTKAVEFLGKQMAGFKLLTEEGGQIQTALTILYQTKNKVFEQDKISALKKQAQVINLFLEKEINSVSVQEGIGGGTISKQFKNIQQIFNTKQQAAVAKASQSDFAAAFNELKASRQALLNQAPSLFFKIEGSQKFCLDNLAVLNSQKPNLAKLSEKIEKVAMSLRSDAAKSSEISAIVNELLDIRQNIADFIRALEVLNSQCASPNLENQELTRAINDVKVLGIQISQDLALWKAQWLKYKSAISANLPSF